MELKKEKNGSGQLAHLSLSNSEIVVGVDFSSDSRVNDLIDDPRKDCHLLYPGRTALNLSRCNYCPEHGKQPVLFLIDATWPCAKKMVRLSDNLRQLPKISFDVTRPSEFFIKHQPDPICLSTVETLHRVLELFGASGLEAYDEEDARLLLQPFRRMVEMQIRYAADPTIPRYRVFGGYSDPSRRKRSLKHTRRSVVWQATRGG
jgi:DTW domain-containing protein YfiP